MESLQERIERLRSRAEYTHQQLGECGRSDQTRERLAENVEELDELERQLTGEMIALEKQIIDTDALMRLLSPVLEILISLRYTDGLKWEVIEKSLLQC